MTTIVSNGYYLITDHRSKCIVESPLKTTGTVGTIGFNHDHTDKLFLSDNLVSGKERIVAFGLAGDCAGFNWLLNALENSQADVDLAFLSCVLTEIKPWNNGDQAKRFTLLGLTEKQESILLDFQFRGEDTSCAYEVFPKGTSVVTGSGGDYFTKISRHIKEIESLSPETIFLYCTSMDKHSSTTYGCYGSAERHKFSDVTPSMERIKESRQAVQQAAVEGLTSIWAESDEASNTD